ncbi:D-arabinono-1,4-lactone oxidase, partial [Ascosphaera atra]
AFEWLMREMGGKPHWAKNFIAAREEFAEMYGSDLEEFLRVRNAADPAGMFLGEWHRRNILPAGTGSERLPLEEREVSRRRANEPGAGDGLEWVGSRQ